MVRIEPVSTMRAKLGFHPRMRLRAERDFQRAYREGSRAHGRWLRVVAVANGGEWTRLGLSVGRRIWPDAVPRNRLRRLMREAFRTTYPELPRGVDLVLIPAEPRLAPTLEDLRAELPRLAAKAFRRYLEKGPPRPSAREERA